MEKSKLKEEFGALPKDAAGFRELLLKDEKGTGGALSARDRIVSLFDEGTFTETSAFSAGIRADSYALESVICGYGAIDGRLVYAFAQDMSRTKGAVTEAAAKKITALYKLAVQNGAPVVGIFDSAGAYLPEGISALAGYGIIMKAVSDASGVIPQIAIAAGVVQGAAAVIASMCDFVVACEKSVISVNPSFAVGGGKCSDSVENGIASFTAKDDAEAIAKTRELVSYLPSNNEEGTAELEAAEDVNTVSDISAYRASGSIKDAIKSAADNGQLFELREKYGAGMVTGFIALGGTVCGAVGTDGAVNGGRITSAGARKAAEFISFCDCFDIPVITFVDSEGFAVSGEEEKNPFSSEIGKLTGVYASAKTALVTVIAGRAYGSVFSFLGSKAVGADIVYALDSAKAACMNPASAVALLRNNEISGKVTREELENEWSENEANIINAAFAGEIDDIIEASELRQRLASAVYMLGAKSAYAPKRRHSNMPL